MPLIRILFFPCHFKPPPSLQLIAQSLLSIPSSPSPCRTSSNLATPPQTTSPISRPTSTILSRACPISPSARRKTRMLRPPSARGHLAHSTLPGSLIASLFRRANYIATLEETGPHPPYPPILPLTTSLSSHLARVRRPSTPGLLSRGPPGGRRSQARQCPSKARVARA